MASSLRTQLRILVDSNDLCSNLSSSYLHSILDCAYASGATAGIFRGCLADRIGRRRVALLGLFSMSACCASMGFATDLASCTVFRFVAGLASSAVVVTTPTMLGDLSQTPAGRVKNLARLPLVAMCGSIGPLVEGTIAGRAGVGGALWQRYPMLSSQIACGSLVFAIALAGTVALREVRDTQTIHKSLVRMLIVPKTLPCHDRTLPLDPDDMDSEKAAFLNQSLTDGSSTVPSISVVDLSRPEAISIGHFVRAPYLLVLLVSFSLLSLHVPMFDVLLPHLGDSSMHSGSVGIDVPCSPFGFQGLVVRLVAGVVVFHVVPKAVASRGLVQPYRACSLLLPAVYVATPTLALVVARSGVATSLLAGVAMATQHVLAGSAQALVMSLVLNAAPDAFSTGTVVGGAQVASLFKALAVCASGASYHLSDEARALDVPGHVWGCGCCSGPVRAGGAKGRDGRSERGALLGDVLRRRASGGAMGNALPSAFAPWVGRRAGALARRSAATTPSSAGPRPHAAGVRCVSKASQTHGSHQVRRPPPGSPSAGVSARRARRRRRHAAAPCDKDSRSTKHPIDSIFARRDNYLRTPLEIHRSPPIPPSPTASGLCQCLPACPSSSLCNPLEARRLWLS